MRPIVHENTVELFGTYGSDLTHAQSAWISTSRELTDEKLGRVDKLLKFLAENAHETPFEKSALHFLVVTDIATHIHLIKHRIGVSVNSESARYKEFTEDKYYLPHDWPDDLKELLDDAAKNHFALYHRVTKELVRRGFSRKRAKESARLFLPYNTQIAADVQFNFRSFMHFLRLRKSDDAQLEVRELAEKMLALVKETRQFDLSLAAYGFLEN